MARINILPKNIAELIAAGEVVERPASVVKELVENSIDAGSSTITVEIKNGGVSYIRVTDNGHGIYYEDVPKAFISHATSKVMTADDLNSIFTLGFRGEALASIAAVSKTEILTKSPEEQHGTSYIVHGGEEISYEFAGCPDGTTIVVRDLFFNTPARMKFLKKDVSEANAVADVIDKLALSHPEISFRFIRDGKQTLITPGDTKLLSAVYAVFGKAFAETLIETEYELDGVKIRGLICKPISSRASRAMQFFFLNGRYIKSRACTASLENAYKNSIMVGKFPACVLNISVPLHTVDVNVHPTKTEVRFSDERKIFSAVYYAVKSAIEELDTRPKLDLNKVAQKASVTGVQLHMVENAKESVPVESVKARAETKKDFWSNISTAEFKSESSVASSKKEIAYETAADEPDLIGSSYKNAVKKDASSTFTRPKTTVDKVLIKEDSEISSPIVGETVETVDITVQTESDIKEENTVIFSETPETKSLRYIGEAFKTYIICECDGKLCLIDKHAAHERIIFNELKKKTKDAASQMLLSPVTVTLGKNEYNAVIENLVYFEESGFCVDDFGKGTVIIRECPMFLDVNDAHDVVIEIAQNLLIGKTDASSDVIDMMLHTSACKAAIKAGNKNSSAELEKLAKQVLTEDSIRYCPHGRPVLIELSEYDLEKQFKRII